ncbi:hypothetical protein TPASS_0950 [Treponema pallidum subsp. pallidum SS14]|uniref:Uncharacterized protein TP_0950 n=2 Tax=Treponema pallidum subsp. pallidum TaxID=161 RepID=Y950_TREPA|nr:RecName: Full=Uncharacterized protein TP_0950 [Treponema pallidum subsp. pallidum str. Nichols]AAC65912.1 predicted coding region TP0950 [Treponema pallidum subsp. pallidum str. Nichols]ACD71366.1 hypothetical protein TPASS_0950 [Treponema pallidum subsp. pallidum SS14]
MWLPHAFLRVVSPSALRLMPANGCAVPAGCVQCSNRDVGFATGARVFLCCQTGVRIVGSLLLFGAAMEKPRAQSRTTAFKRGVSCTQKFSRSRF